MIKILGVPSDINSSFLKGSALAPNRIRQIEKDGSTNSFAENGKEILNGKAYCDLGDIVLTEQSAENSYKIIKQRISAELADSNPIICLGGDHSISYPIIEAFSNHYKTLHVLHLDAHADLYDNFDNNPYSHASPFARIMEKKLVSSLTQIGIRTLNTHQKAQAAKYNVKLQEMKDFNFRFIKELKAPLYISIDLDILDPAFAPGVSHHEPGGLTTRDLIHIIQSINVKIVGADIVEYNPIRDLNSCTAMLSYKLLKEIISVME
jgi:agmatinase